MQEQMVRANRKKPEFKMGKSAKDAEIQAVDWSNADPTKWSFHSVTYGGSYSYKNKPDFEEVDGPISGGIERLKTEPHQYEALYHQTNMVDWPEDQQKYTLVVRKPKTMIRPTGTVR